MGGGAIVAVVLFATFVVSRPALDGHVWTWKTGWWVRLDFGDVEFGKMVPAPPEFDPAFVWQRGHGQRYEWMMYCVGRPDYSISIWPIILAAIASAGTALYLDIAAARRARRRAREGRCVKCDYDLTGLPAESGGRAVCPECGTAPGISRSNSKTATDDTDAHG